MLRPLALALLILPACAGQGSLLTGCAGQGSLLTGCAGQGSLLTGCAGSIAPYDPAKEAQRRADLEVSLRTKLGAAYDQPVAALDQADLELGHEVYYKNCDACHGAHGQGDGPRAVRMKPRPTNFLMGQRLSDAGELEVIRSGSPGTGMSAFSRSFDEHYMLAAYRYVKWLRANPPEEEDEE